MPGKMKGSTGGNGTSSRSKSGAGGGGNPNAGRTAVMKTTGKLATTRSGSGAGRKAPLAQPTSGAGGMKKTSTKQTPVSRKTSGSVRSTG